MKETYLTNHGLALAEIDKLRAAIKAIQDAANDGRVCDDVAWFNDHETLYDFCEDTLNAE